MDLSDGALEEKLVVEFRHEERTEGGIETDLSLDEMASAEACAMELLPTGCLDLDLSLLFLDIDKDLPLDDIRGPERSLLTSVPCPRVLYSSGRIYEFFWIDSFGLVE